MRMVSQPPVSRAEVLQLLVSASCSVAHSGSGNVAQMLARTGVPALMSGTKPHREEKCCDPRRCPPPGRKAMPPAAKQSVMTARRATGWRRKVMRRHGAQIVSCRPLPFLRTTATPLNERVHGPGHEQSKRTRLCADSGLVTSDQAAKPNRDGPQSSGDASWGAWIQWARTMPGRAHRPLPRAHTLPRAAAPASASDPPV